MSALRRLLGDDRWVVDLERRFPKFAAGLATAVEVVHLDGALDAGFKALCVAVIGSVKGDPTLVREYLSRARGGGITVEQARGAGINLLISRGIGPYRLFVEAVRELFGGEVPEGPPFGGAPPVEDILAYYRGLYGEVPPNVRLARDHAPPVLDAYYLMRTAALEESPIEPRLADLLLCALNAAEHQQVFVQIHARFALRGGATPAQLVEAVSCAIPFAGIAAWLPGANGVIGALEETAG